MSLPINKAANPKNVFDTEKLKGILNQELSYKQLCEALGVKQKRGDSQKAQLEDLELFCDLEVIKDGTKKFKYKVVTVYEFAFDFYKALARTNDIRFYFEAAVYQLLLENGCKPLYVSYTELMMKMGQITAEFCQARDNPMWLKQNYGEDSMDMSVIASVAYRMLKDWTNKELRIMFNRHSINLTRGYRLYHKIVDETGGVVARGKYNVYPNTEDAEICQSIFNQATSDMTSFKGYGWYNTADYQRMCKTVDSLVLEHYKGKYDSARQVLVISCPSEKWVRDRLSEVYRGIEAKSKIRGYVTNKIVSEKSLLNEFTRLELLRFAKFAIDNNIDIDE